MTDQAEDKSFQGPVARTGADAPDDIDAYLLGKKPPANPDLNTVTVIAPEAGRTAGGAVPAKIEVAPSGPMVSLPGLTVEDTTDRPGSRIQRAADSPEVRNYTLYKDSVVRLQGSTESGAPTTGTGFFVNSEGLLVTDYHVAGKIGNQMIVQMANGRKYTATVVEVFKEKDLAAMQIQFYDGTKSTGVTLPSGPTTFQRDARVAALGFPDGNPELHISPGVYLDRGALNEERITGGYLPGEDEKRSIHRMRMDTRPGNSGSLVFSLDTGQVIGIQGFSNQFGRTIVTPAQDVKALVDAVNARRQAALNPGAPLATGAVKVFDIRSPLSSSVTITGNRDPLFTIGK